MSLSSLGLKLRSYLVVLYARLTQVVDAALTGVASAHAGQKLRIAVLAAVHFALASTGPGLFDHFVLFQLALPMQAHANLC